MHSVTMEEAAARLPELAAAAERGEEVVINGNGHGNYRLVYEVKTPYVGMTFQEILAPAQAGFDATGMTDDELGDFLVEEVRAYRREKMEQGGLL